MAPSIALNNLRRKRTKPLVVLDPMTGSGTTVMVARRFGHRAIGFDTDPLAALLTSVCTGYLQPEALVSKARIIELRASELCRDLPIRDAYPLDSDEETKSFVRYWFDPSARRQLASLASVIRAASGPLVPALWCAFSRLIIAKENGASLARDLSHSRPHKVYKRAPIRPLECFHRAADFVAANAPFTDGRTDVPAARIEVADARRMPLKRSSVDLIITSPPYLNAIDYVRCSKFTLVWLGYRIAELRALRATNIGCEVSHRVNDEISAVAAIVNEVDDGGVLAPRDRAIVSRYLHDMDTVIEEMSRVLRPDGRAIVVIGNSNVRGHFIENSLALSRLFARHGLVEKRRVVRDLPPNRRYMPPPSRRTVHKGLHGRMRQEVVLTFARG